MQWHSMETVVSRLTCFKLHGTVVSKFFHPPPSPPWALLKFYTCCACHTAMPFAFKASDFVKHISLSCLQLIGPSGIFDLSLPTFTTRNVVELKHSVYLPLAIPELLLHHALRLPEVFVYRFGLPRARTMTPRHEPDVKKE